MCDECGDRFCLDCKTEDWDIYIVHDWLWEKYLGDQVKISLCIRCFEKRMGRKLTASDLPFGNLERPILCNIWVRENIKHRDKILRKEENVFKPIVIQYKENGQNQKRA